MIDTLARVAAEQTAASEIVQPPASEEQIAALRAATQKELDAQLPDDFADYLMIANGIDFDGVVIYGASQSPQQTGPGGFWQGLVAANLKWRETGDRAGYVILGETGMDILTVDANGRNPVVRDRVSGDIVEEFVSVRAMLESCLAAHLD